MKLKTVLLEITDKCNLQCKHCMNRPDFVGCELGLDRMRELFAEFEKYSAEKIYISGGEPLLHSRINEIIQICGQFSNLKFVITTNGLLLSEELMTQIQAFDNLTLQFSIDGVTSNTYDYLRGKGKYNCFLEIMKVWDNAVKHHGLARTCLNKQNYLELPQIYTYCLQHKLYPSFVFISRLGNGVENWDDLELNTAQKIWCIDAINKLNDQFGLNITTPEAPATCNFTENTGVSSLLIRADGRVAPCQYFYDDSLGNIFEQSIPALLESPWIEEHCKIAQQRRSVLENSPKCLSCKIKSGCNFGCMGIANDLGNIMSYDGLCELRVMTTLCYSNRLIRKNGNTQKTNVVQVGESLNGVEEGLI